MGVRIPLGAHKKSPVRSGRGSVLPDRSNSPHQQQFPRLAEVARLQPVVVHPSRYRRSVPLQRIFSRGHFIVHQRGDFTPHHVVHVQPDERALGNLVNDCRRRVEGVRVVLPQAITRRQQAGRVADVRHHRVHCDRLRTVHGAGRRERILGGHQRCHCRVGLVLDRNPVEGHARPVGGAPRYGDRLADLDLGGRRLEPEDLSRDLFGEDVRGIILEEVAQQRLGGRLLSGVDPLPGVCAGVTVVDEAPVELLSVEAQCGLGIEFCEDQRLVQFPVLEWLVEGGCLGPRPLVVMHGVEIERAVGVAARGDQPGVGVIVVIRGGHGPSDDRFDRLGEAVPFGECRFDARFLGGGHVLQSVFERCGLGQAVHVRERVETFRAGGDLRHGIRAMDEARGLVYENLDVAHRDVKEPAPSEFVAHPLRLVEHLPGDNRRMAFEGLDHRYEAILEVGGAGGGIGQERPVPIRLFARIRRPGHVERPDGEEQAEAAFPRQVEYLFQIRDRVGARTGHPAVSAVLGARRAVGVHPEPHRVSAVRLDRIKKSGESCKICRSRTDIGGKIHPGDVCTAHEQRNFVEFNSGFGL